MNAIAQCSFVSSSSDILNKCSSLTVEEIAQEDVGTYKAQERLWWLFHWRQRRIIQ